MHTCVSMVQADVTALLTQSQAVCADLGKQLLSDTWEVTQQGWRAADLLTSS